MKKLRSFVSKIIPLFLILIIGTTFLGTSSVTANELGAKLYITNMSPSSISQADLDGSSGVNLGNLGGNLNFPLGIALDIAAGKMYVVNYLSNEITRANLDGTGAENLGSLGGTLNSPSCIALDIASGKMYVANRGNGTVSQANLDGTGGVSLGNFGGNLDAPMGIALDTANGKIYVADYGASYDNGYISRANLDGSGGESLGNLGGLVLSPRHIAIDISSGKLYIAEQSGNAVIRSNLDGTGGESLGNLNGTISSPYGIALDLDAGKMYVVNNGNWTLSQGNLDGSGGISLGFLGGLLTGPTGIALDTTRPEIDIQGNGMSISDGDSSPSTSDDTEFGSALVAGGSVDHTFTIENVGSADLILSGTPLVGISGTNPGDFSVITPPSSPIAAGSTTTFTIRFDPSAEGIRSARVSVDSYDNDKSTFDFDVQGTGTPSVNFSLLSQPGSESIGTMVVTAQLSAASSVDVTVPYSLSGTAIEGAGADYTITSSPITFTGGSTSENVNITVNDDGLSENNETVILTMGSPTNAVLGSSNTEHTATILDNDDAPTVVFGSNTNPADGAAITTGPTQIMIEFSKDVKNDSSPEAANTLANYILVRAGVGGAIVTSVCGPVDPADTAIAINAVTYDNNSGAGPFIATLDINDGTPLPIGTYRLLVCGTTSIEDLAGNELNDGLSDALLDFSVIPASLPDTGFRKGAPTDLSALLSDVNYSETAITLVIPSLDIELPVVGVPLMEDGWEIAGLYHNAGYLEGSAFPTWAGNTVITGHVWDAYNNPGAFVNIKNLGYGDKIQLRAWGLTYTYEVRERKLLLPNRVNYILQHEEYDWITLLTCEFYNPFNENYLFRRSVRAVLVDVR